MWEIEKVEYLHRSPFASVARKYVRDFRGERQEFFFLELRDFCNIIPITAAGEVVLVKQFRVGSESYTLEVPGGVIDPRDADEQVGALREMREETGYGLKTGGRVRSLGWSHPNPALQGNRCHYFACGPVEVQGEIRNDPNERTETVLVPIRDIRRMIRESQITHALVLNAFQFVELHQEADSFQPFEVLLQELCRVEKN